MEPEKSAKGKRMLRLHLSARQKLSYRMVFLVSTISLTLIILLCSTFNLTNPGNAGAPTPMETLRSGSFLITMGITPQTVATGLKPYGLVYDLINNYYVP